MEPEVFSPAAAAPLPPLLELSADASAAFFGDPFTPSASASASVPMTPVVPEALIDFSVPADGAATSAVPAADPSSAVLQPPAEQAAFAEAPPAEQPPASPAAEAPAPEAPGAAAHTPPSLPANKSDADLEYEAEIAGLTALTMTSCRKHTRVVSYTNADLPPMLYETEGGGSAAGDGLALRRKSLRRRRSHSLTEMVAAEKPGGVADGPKQTLAYWKLEKELRLARDNLSAKAEECASLDQYREQLTAEMDELTVKLFEEAHEMVRVEKQARHLAEKRATESQSKLDVMEAELKAFKLVVAQLSEQRARAAQADVRNGGKGAQAHADQQGGPQSKQQEVDPVVFDELSAWLKSAAKGTTSPFLARVEAEDVLPCMRFHPDAHALARDLLLAVQQNNIILEAVPPPLPSQQACALCRAVRSCPFRLRVIEPAGAWLHVCTTSRNKVVAVCNFYMFARHVSQGLVKGNAKEVYWRVASFRAAMNLARLNMPNLPDPPK